MMADDEGLVKPIRVFLDVDDGVLVARIETQLPVVDAEYAFYLQCDGKRIETHWYSREAHVRFIAKLGTARYRAIGFVRRHGETNVQMFSSAPLQHREEGALGGQLVKLPVNYGQLSKLSAKSLPVSIPTRRHIRLKEWTPLVDRLMRPEPTYLAATDGSLRDIDYRVRTDSDGYILPASAELEVVADSVIFLGDSFVESVYVPEEQRFVAAIQKTLGDAGVPARCLNAGYSGATTLHLLMLLIGKIGRRRETTIVLVVPSNDVYSLVKKNGFWCRDDKRYAPLVPVPDNDRGAAQPLDLDDLEAALNLFVEACRSLSLNLILATFPHRTAEFTADPWLFQRFKSASNYERILRGRLSVNAVTRAVANRFDLPFIDLEAAVSRRIGWFYDDLHLNEVGSAGLEQVLGNFLVTYRRSLKAII